MAETMCFTTTVPVWTLYDKLLHLRVKARDHKNHLKGRVNRHFQTKLAEY